MLASAGDDGNVLLWVPSELQHTPLGEDHSDDQEIWRVKHMCRSSGAEIYDLAWSPDGVFFITGSMDNIARIYNAQTGKSQKNEPHSRTKCFVTLVNYFFFSFLHFRSNGSADCGTLPLRARGRLGSPK